MSGRTGKPPAAAFSFPLFPAFANCQPVLLRATIGDHCCKRKVRAVMDRPIPKYLDYIFGADAEACLRVERRERDLTLLRAIRSQSFGPAHSAYLYAESKSTSVYARADILSPNIVRNKSRRTERVPIRCSAPPNCRGHPCSPLDPLSRCTALSRYGSQSLQQAAELSRLVEAANTVCESSLTQPELLVMRGSLQDGSRKTPARRQQALRFIT